MKNKFIIVAFIMALFMCFSVCYANTPLSFKSQEEVINVIRLMEIANGDQNGDMMLESKVTRAQFVKMAVSASASKQNAQETKLNVSLFSDVNSDFWGAGYILVGVKTGLITGYLDGTFRPDNNVKLEEAVTIVLKLLGYTENEVMGSYPNSQIAKYQSLELDTGIDAKVGENLTRYECIRLIYNALSTKNKSGSVYCTTLGYKTDSDGIIDYNALVESKLNGPYVITAPKSDVLKATLGNGYNNFVYYRDGKASGSSEISEYDALYYVKEINTAWVYSSKIFGVVQSILPDSINPTSAVISENTVNITSGAIGTDRLKDDVYVMLVLDRTGSAFAIYQADANMYDKYHNEDSDFYDLILSSVTSPYVVTDTSNWKALSEFNVDNNTKYLYNSTVVSENNVCTHDVLYYSEVFNTILIYRKTATGIIKDVTKQNNVPVSVVLTDKTYNLATSNVKKMFAVNGKYSKQNCFVTLLLGINGVAVSAIDGDINKIADNTDNASYLEIVNMTLEGPYKVLSTGKINGLPFNSDEAKYISNGQSILPQDIRKNDIYYYSELLKSVWIYRDTASGVLEEINNTTSPSSIVVSGKTYSIESDDASFALSAFGTFNIGDTVTVLLGKDGVADVVLPTDDSASYIYGIVTDKGKKTFKKSDGTSYTAEYVTVTDTDCQVYTYEYENSYFADGDVVRVIVGNKVSISKQTINIGSGNVSKIKNAILNGDFASNCEIIDTYKENVKKISVSRISGLDIDTGEFIYSGIVKFYSFNENDEIERLILNDFTGDLHDYGVVTSSGDGAVKYLLDGNEKIYSTDNYVSEGPAMIKNSISGVTAILPLRAYMDIDVLTNFDSYDKDGNRYLLSDRVKVYIAGAASYTYSNIDDVMSDDYVLRGYYDKSPERGGRIRVIIAYKAV